jgi:hypothetical protein
MSCGCNRKAIGPVAEQCLRPSRPEPLLQRARAAGVQDIIAEALEDWFRKHRIATNGPNGHE